MRLRAPYPLTLIAVALLHTASLHAQDAPPATEAAPPSGATDGSVDLDTVVVTAQKKLQNLQEVPVSVGVINARDLQDSGNFDSGALENSVANVEIDIDPQSPVIGIRGFATETDNVGFDPSVGLTIDGVALGRPEFVADGLFDLAQIEVLRGTQGTLFGKNTIAGVINFISVEPEPYFSGDVLAAGGDPFNNRIEAALNVPVGEALALRGAAMGWSRDGDVRNTALDRREGSFEQTAGRLSAVYAPLDSAWTVKFSTQLADNHTDYAPWQFYDASEAALAYARVFDPGAEDNPLDARTSFDQPGYVERNSSLSRVQVDYDHGAVMGFDEWVTTAVLGHGSFAIDCFFDIDVSAADLINTRFINEFAQDSLELRGAGVMPSPFGFDHKLDVVGGLYAYHSDLDSDLDTLSGDNLLGFALSSAGFEALGLDDIPELEEIADLLDSLQPLPDAPIDDALLRSFRQRSESYAAFGQASWYLTEQLALIGGLRYSVETKSATFDVSRDGPGLIALIVGAETYQTQRSRDEVDFSPKLGLQYEWSPQFMTYASWTRGYKGGGFNATAETPENLEFEPETAQTWEAGFKSRIAKQLTINLSAYQTDVDDLQVVDYVDVAFQVNNAAQARLQGVELETQWRPRRSWLSVSASAAWGSAEYVDYRDAPESGEQSNGVAGLCGKANGEGQQDLSGCPLVNAPEYSANLSPVLTVPLGDWRLLAGVDLSWRGDQYSAPDLDSHSFQEGYLLVGSRLAFGPANQRWTLIAAGSNLTDERAKDLVIDNFVYADTYTAQQIPLKSLLLMLRLSW